MIVIAPERPPTIVIAPLSGWLTALPFTRITAPSEFFTVMVAPSEVISGLEMFTGRMTVALTLREASLMFAPADTAAVLALTTRAKMFETMCSQSHHDFPFAIVASSTVSSWDRGCGSECRNERSAD